MSQTSNWPLSGKGIRLRTPQFLRQYLAQHPLSAGCYPTAIGFYPRAADHFMTRLSHDDNLIMLCIDGAGYVEAGSASTSVGPGDCVLLPRDTAHYYRADYARPWTIYWAHFGGRQAAEIMRYLGSPNNVVIHPGGHPSLLNDFERLLRVQQTGYSKAAYLAAAGHLRHILTSLPLFVRAAQDPRANARGPEQVQRFMRDNVHRHITLDELAEFAGSSRSHFSEQYKQATGHAPIKHFTHFRMQAACRLLDTTELPIADIATLLGFDDPLYFSRVFRKVIGLAPRSYRRAAAA